MTEAVVRTAAGVRDVRVRDKVWSVSSSQVHLTVPALLAALAREGAELSMLTTHSATLEDVFVALTGRQLNA